MTSNTRGSGLAYLLLAVFHDYGFALKESVVPSILLVVLFSPSSLVVTPSSLAPKSVKIVSSNKHRNSCVCPEEGGGEPPELLEYDIGT